MSKHNLKCDSHEKECKNKIFCNIQILNKKK